MCLRHKPARHAPDENINAENIVIAALTGMKYSSTASTICPPAMPKMPDKNAPENVAAAMLNPANREIIYACFQPLRAAFVRRAF